MPVDGVSHPRVAAAFFDHHRGGHCPIPGPSNKGKHMAEDSDDGPAKRTRKSPRYPHVNPGKAHWRNVSNIPYLILLALGWIAQIN